MNLEAAVQENTAALRDLIATVKAHGVPTPVAASEPAKPTKAPAASAAQTSAKPVQPEAPAGKALTYEADIKPVALKVIAKSGNPGLKAVLGKYGAEKAFDVPAEKYPDLLADLKAALA